MVLKKCHRDPCRGIRLNTQRIKKWVTKPLYLQKQTSEKFSLKILDENFFRITIKKNKKFSCYDTMLQW